MVGLTEDDMLPYYTYIVTEGDVPPEFSCYHNGYPSLYVTWTTPNGGSLPVGVNQFITAPDILQLQFTFPLAYNDILYFVCTLQEPLEMTYANLELRVRGE